MTQSGQSIQHPDLSDPQGDSITRGNYHPLQDTILAFARSERLTLMPHVYCPACGTQNDSSARFCDSCGRSLADVGEVRAATRPPIRGDQKDRQGRLLGADGRPVGDDIDGSPVGERVLWSGRPSWLWSPRMALTVRYRLTNQRLIMETGFVGRHTEEIDLYRVNDVAVKQNPFERIVNIGDIDLTSADATTPHRVLHNISDPIRLKDLLREASRQERDRRRVLVREDVQIADDFS